MRYILFNKLLAWSFHNLRRYLPIWDKFACDWDHLACFGRRGKYCLVGKFQKRI